MFGFISVFVLYKKQYKLKIGCKVELLINCKAFRFLLIRLWIFFVYFHASPITQVGAIQFNTYSGASGANNLMIYTVSMSWSKPKPFFEAVLNSLFLL